MIKKVICLDNDIEGFDLMFEGIYIVDYISNIFNQDFYVLNGVPDNCLFPSYLFMDEYEYLDFMDYLEETLFDLKIKIDYEL